jgi:His/Glu/Gln/Arg/opine family amino acid ABC transporter permease subunit
VPREGKVLFRVYMLLEGFGWQLLAGAKITILVSICAIALGHVLGLLGAAGELSQRRWLAHFTRNVTAVIRGLPELLTLFAIYFGGTILLSQLFGTYVEINAFISGVIALGIIFGAYAAQVFRGAFLMVARGQREAAKALALSSWQMFYKITFPQAWRHALPGLGNLWLTTLKDSSLIALIGLAELTNKTQIAANETHKPFVFYFACALIYLALTTVTQLSLKYCQYRVSYYEH